MSYLPEFLITRREGPTPEWVWKDLALRYPECVREGPNGWECDLWRERGMFSPAAKALYSYDTSRIGYLKAKIRRVISIGKVSS